MGVAPPRPAGPLRADRRYLGLRSASRNRRADGCALADVALECDRPIDERDALAHSHQPETGVLPCRVEAVDVIVDRCFDGLALRARTTTLTRVAAACLTMLVSAPLTIL